MKKFICLLTLLSLLSAGPVLAFEENKFAALLQKFNRVAVPLAASASKTDVYQKGNPANSGQKGNQANKDFVWLKADEVNKQIEAMIQGIESAKSVATALAIIVNLYNSNKISVEVALTAVQLLKLRAVFLKIFISNGQSELEVMINILQEHEDEFGKQVQAKTQANVGAKGKISLPAQ